MTYETCETFMMHYIEWNAYAHVSCNAIAHASLTPRVLHNQVVKLVNNNNINNT
jgi:hypothetical protein